jgi:hypothetical protein
MRAGIAMGALAVVFIVPGVAQAAVLYDQTDNGDGAFMSSNDFGDVHTDQLADDFTVPAGESWQISEVQAIGFVHGTPPPNVNVWIYSNAGTLPGAALFHAAAIPGARTPGGDYTIPLAGTPPLTPGTYWLSIQQTSPGNFFAGDGWFWQDRTVPAGNPLVYRQPSGTSCTDWTPKATCTGDATELGALFRLSGSVAPPSIPAPVPSNQFTLGQPKLNRRKGTAKEPVTVPGPGELTLTGKGVLTQRPARASASRAVTAAGTVKLLVKPKGKIKRKLNSTGKARVKVTVTYAPTGGGPNAQTKKIRLRKRLG